MTEGGSFSVLRQAGAAGIQDIQTVLVFIAADMGMTVENDIAVIFLCGTLEMFKGAFYAENIAVGSENAVLSHRKNEKSGTEAADIAVSADMDNSLGVLGVHSEEAVQISFTVAEVEEPVGVGISEKN